MTGGNVGGTRRLNPLLRMAVMAGVESAVQIHIERGDDLDARDVHGMTALMLAAARNKAEICRQLLNAGADHRLLDPLGRTALDVATSCGSDATAAILHTLRASIQPLSPVRPESTPPSMLDGVPDESDSLPDSASLADRAASERPQSSVALPETSHDEEFDLSGWEAEEEPTRPEVDSRILDSASAVQIAITAHEPIDSSAEWDDIDAYLPEVALPLARTDDAESRARLRLLLLRALREGSVPALDVQAQSTNEDRSANSAAETYLAMVINDMGAEVDERFEYTDADESFEVFVNPEESPAEEEALDEALAAIDRAASPRHEPLQIYQREFQRLRLLTADEEVRLAKDMEGALDAALDELADWPDGIVRTLAAGAEAVAGTRPLSSIWVGGEPDPEPASAEDPDARELAQAEPPEANNEDGEPEVTDAGGSVFAEALCRLGELVEGKDVPRASILEIRQALAGLRLNRRFLLELVDAAKGPAPCTGFQAAMAGFCRARDWMTEANLKLAFFHAKKYLYSGEPLDDLAQEGNVGLLKAVDRYDWRRGFRFSTYATWWIRQQIGRYVADKGRTIRVPVHIYEKLHRAEREAQAFERSFGREPTVDELASRVEVPAKKLEALMRLAHEPLPIDDLTIDDMIAMDVREEISPRDPADVVADMQLCASVDRYISSLSTKGRKEELVLRLRFGIGIGETLTLDEVGQRFGVTRERIRQIEAKAIKKLKHPARSELFVRSVLGLEPDAPAIAAGAHEPDGIEVDNVADATRTEASASHTDESNFQESSFQAPEASLQTELERALAQAATLGVHVDDDRLNSGHILVVLLQTPGRGHRLLAHRLIVLGFNFVPGKGYWK